MFLDNEPFKTEIKSGNKFFVTKTSLLFEFFYKSYLFSYFLKEQKIHTLNSKPVFLPHLGSKKRALDIIKNLKIPVGKSDIYLNNYLLEKETKNRIAYDYYNKFYWINDLVKLNTQKSYNIICHMLREWNNSYFRSINSNDDLANVIRCFNLFNSFNFLYKKSDNILYSFVYKIYFAHIKYLKKSYSGFDPYLKLISLSLLIGFDCYIFGKKIKKSKYFNIYIQELKNQILNDGMHYSINSNKHTMVLNSALLVFYILNDQNESSDDFYKYITKMSTIFEFLMINKKNLFIVNGSYVGNLIENKQLLILLYKNNLIENNNKDKKWYNNVLNNSGIIKIQTKSFNIIVDSKINAVKRAIDWQYSTTGSFELYYDNIPVLVNSGSQEWLSDKFKKLLCSNLVHNSSSLLINDIPLKENLKNNDVFGRGVLTIKDNETWFNYSINSFINQEIIYQRQIYSNFKKNKIVFNDTFISKNNYNNYNNENDIVGLVSVNFHPDIILERILGEHNKIKLILKNGKSLILEFEETLKFKVEDSIYFGNQYTIYKNNKLSFIKNLNEKQEVIKWKIYEN